MKMKWHYVLAVTIVAVGVGSLLGYDLYAKPYLFSKTVVKVKVNKDYLPKNYKLTAKDLYEAKIAVEDVPGNALTDTTSAVGKIINVNLSDGVILTKDLVDVDDLEPGNQEGIFSIPKDVIFAINGTLRQRDHVNIFLVKDPSAAVKRSPNSENTLNQPINDKPFLENVLVSYVRTEDNNDVVDSTDKGNTNKRLTSTGRVASPEIKLTQEQGSSLLKQIESGFKVWIVRVD
jgi:hypothetical protein